MKMKKHIIGENGISYTLGEAGFYYPDLRLPDETEYDIERFGRMNEIRGVAEGIMMRKIALG